MTTMTTTYIISRDDELVAKAMYLSSRNLEVNNFFQFESLLFTILLLQKDLLKYFQFKVDLQISFCHVPG